MISIRLVLFSLLLGGGAQALPLFTAREGRTCDNCHVSPTGWPNPEDVAARKCSLSCVGCHVDPAGGGLRTVSGRYFAMSTLPMFRAKRRPWMDQDRTVQALVRRWVAPDAVEPSTQPSTMPATQPSTQPSTMPAAPTEVDVNDFPVFGRPLFHGSEMAWLDGRYGELNADPLLMIGADARFGYWNEGPLYFPMQLDLDVALHPIEHLTFATIVGARGRRDSLAFEGDGDDQPRFGVRDLWVMTHEWPYLAYLRAGRFLPPFGTRVEDHTAYIRRAFGLSQEDPANRVIGAEVGMSPNYPYLNAALFKPSTIDARNPLEPEDGWGTAVSLGWRDLGWQAGASYMLRQRSLRLGGDTQDLSLQWGLNPWYYFPRVPLTYLGEVSMGQIQRPFSGTETLQVAWYHELDWSLVPGLVLRARFDYWDPDREVVDDEIARPGFGGTWTILSWVEVLVDGRIGMPAGGRVGSDVFVQLHLWL